MLKVRRTVGIRVVTYLCKFNSLGCASVRFLELLNAATHLLVCQAAVGEHAICLGDLMTPPANVLRFEIRVESLYDIPATMRCRLGKV
jgi:hypothetical protein